MQLVKEANDIVEVVGGYVDLRPAGPTFKGLCPFHDDKRPSFDVDRRRQRYRCWSCGKYGDVITFIQEHEKVSFAEALELLARRAGISLEKNTSSAHNQSRARMLDVCRWAARHYHACLLSQDPLAERAQIYLGKRGLRGETVREYLLGYAPPSGEWLVHKAVEESISFEMLEKVGLVAKREGNRGYYDRFRDRIQFPIHNERGEVVGFGGRILPDSPLAGRTGKYYNSCDTPLFSKSELLYGLHRARSAAAQAGCLAVVEGYTDVLMAHQMGILHVVATMGTALNARHVQKLRRFAPRVVLVFDADAGGQTGADRALGLFASQESDLAIATLPAGLDPCDLLVDRGADAFRQVLEGAVDALDYKLTRVLGGAASRSIEEQRRAVDVILGIIALAPELPGQAGAVKSQLMVTRIAHRLSLKEETVWSRLKELRQRRSQREQAQATSEEPRQAPAAPHERELIELLLADAAMVPRVQPIIRPEMITHPGLRLLLEGLYILQDAGEPANLDQLRPRLENARLAAKALELQDVGRRHPDRESWLQKLLACFRERDRRSELQTLQQKLQVAQAAGDHETALMLLRLIQEPNRP